MLAIGLRFPAGRYHATSWGRHVNEGVPEWPPSPWRLLRALVASWKTKAPHLDETQVRAVLESLALPPSFHLPPATNGHTRHYMPLGLSKKKGVYVERRAKVFDAFVCLEEDRKVTVMWSDAELDEQRRRVLSTLLDGVAYLGRAESWCEARLVDPMEGDPNAWPLNGGSPDAGQELVRVLCADPAKAFEDDHVKPAGRRKGRGKSKRPLYDPAWHLCIETAQLHDEKWSDPPGSQWVTYVRPSDCFDPPSKLRSRPLRRIPHPQVVRFALDSTVLPLVTDTLPVAEAARRALMSRHGRLTERNGVRGRSQTFSGKNAAGEVLRGHRHAYYLPTDEDGDGRLDHVTIVARAGFDADEMRAMDWLSEIRLWRRDNASHPLRVLMLGYGRLDEYQPGLLRPSCVWASATPYIATRVPRDHGKHKSDLQFWRRRSDEEISAAREKGIRLRRFVFADPQGFLQANLREQIHLLHPGVEIDAVEIRPETKIGGRRRPIQFKRYRSKSRGNRRLRLAGGFRVEFPTKVAGPLALGYSSHFGMGLFIPCHDTRSEDHR